LVVLPAVTLAAVLLSAPSAAQPGEGSRPPRNPTERSDLRQYNDLVTAFRRGDDAAASAVATWPDQRVLGIVALLPPAAPEIPAWHPPQFKAAVMMHTAAAIELFKRTRRAEGALSHLEVATEVMRKGREGVSSFVGPWHTAIANMLLNTARPDTLEAFLAHAREQFPGEPAIQFVSGLFSEYAAGPLSFEQLGAEPTTRNRMEPAVERMSRRRAGRLIDAERWIGAAVDSDRGNAGSLLHLGRVEMLRGHDDRAMRLLRQVTVFPGAAVESRYLAVMFTGGLHERAGRVRDAVASYREAAALIPGAQSARIALSEALRRDGRGDESRQVLQDAVRARRSATIDPWWTYFLEGSSVTAERLKQLLAEARR
jgi:hypothetical protein